PPPTQPHTLSLHDALPISTPEVEARRPWALLQRNFVNGQAHVTDDLPPLPVAYVDLAESDRLKQRVGSRARLHVKQTTRAFDSRSEEHTSELQSPYDLVCR